MDRTPLFSVVTACRNDKSNLLATARSLANQTLDDFEWVVVDGASTDGTVDWLQSSPIAQTRWCSEPDGGIYDAFDKGARRSKGAFLVYICAGDELAEPETLARVKAYIEAHPGGDLYYGDAYDVTGGRVTGLRRARSHETIWWNLFTHHQSMFYARRCFAMARYDSSYRIGGDYAFTAEILQRGARGVHMPFATARFQVGGTSYRNYWQGERDNWRTRRELGYGLPARSAIWLLHAGIRLVRVYTPALYRSTRYGSRREATVRRSAPADDDGSETFCVEGITVSAVSPPVAVARIVKGAQKPNPLLVFTLNLDHVAKLRADPVFRGAYHEADLVVADGFPVATVGRLQLGHRVERVCGSDLIVPLSKQAAREGLPVALFGATDATLQASAARLAQECPGLHLAGLWAPPMNFDPSGDAADDAIDRIVQRGHALVFVALGAPKAEVFSARLAHRMSGGAVVSIGAGLDFLAGTKRRAPVSWQKRGLEWAWRLGQEPRRLARRYVVSAAIMPSVIGQGWRGAGRQTTD